MTLNYDCLRAVLLFVEENQTYKPIGIEGFEDTLRLAPIPIVQICSSLSDTYDEYDVLYSCSAAEQADLLECSYRNDQIVYINDITYKGHEFIRVMKNDTVWAKVKRQAASIGGATLESMVSFGFSWISKLLSGDV